MNEEEKKQENRMGTLPIGQLLIKMSLPAMLSMLVQALYNIVDSIFVSRLSEAALTAVSLAFPIQNLMISFAVGTSVGICSVISRRLGEKKEDEAAIAAQTGYTIELLFALVFMVLGFTIVKPFFRLYTSDPELIELGTQYLSICLIAGVGCFVLTDCEKTLQATGDTIHPMLIQMSGAIFNIIFDPLFIFGLFGFPKMGIAGAAVATVAGQILSMVLGVVFVRQNKYVDIKFLRPSLNRNSLKDILQVGIPSIIMQGIGTVMTSLINAILIAYDVIATTVFGVYFKLQSFVFMPVFGLNQGLLPIIGYNYGAKDRERMFKALSLGVVIALAIMCCGTLLFCFCGRTLLGFFNASEAMLETGIPALRIISYSFPLAAVCIIISALFQAIGEGFISMVTSIIRQLVFLVPAAYVFGKLGGLHFVWYSFLFAEVFALALNIFFLLSKKKKLDF